MKHAFAIIVLAVALVATGCAAEEFGATEEVSSTTEAPPTTEAPGTTSATESSTTTTDSSDTTEATTTTSEVAPVEGDIVDLMARLSTPSEVVSGRMEGTIEITGLDPDEAGISEASFGFATAFDARTGNSSFLMDLPLDAAGDAEPQELMEAFGGTMEFRQVGDRVYMKSGFFNLLLGAETEWLSMPADEGAEFSSGFETVPTDPNVVLESYEGAAGTVENVGVESVNGVEATHYRVVFNTEEWVDELTAEEKAELQASGIFADGELPMDIWITEEGHLVRMILEIVGGAADSDMGEFDAMRVRYDAYDLNGDVTITEPPASEVTAIEDLDADWFAGWSEGFGTDA